MLRWQLDWHSTIWELIHYSPEILIVAVSWICLSELSVTFTWSKQEKNKDVGETDDAEEYHPTNKKRLLPLFYVTLFKIFATI